MNFNSLTLFDYGIACILFFFVARGVWIGFIRQLATFFAFVGSYWLAGRYAGELLPYVQQMTESPKVVFLISFSGLLLISAIIFSLIGKLLHKVLEVKLLGSIDRFFLGTLLGLVKGVLVNVVVYIILSSSLAPTDYFFPDSLTSPYIDKGAEFARQFIQDPTIRTALIPNEPTDQEEKLKKSGGKASVPSPASRPLSGVPDETESTETQLNPKNDDPGSSTEILTHE